MFFGVKPRIWIFKFDHDILQFVEHLAACKGACRLPHQNCSARRRSTVESIAASGELDTRAPVRRVLGEHVGSEPLGHVKSPINFIAQL